MKKISKMLVMMGLISICGCATSMVYEDSKKELIMKKAIANNDQYAIKAVQLNNGVGLGIDLNHWQVLSVQPFKQLGAALLDAGMIYGGYKGIEYLVNRTENNSETHDTQITTTGDNNNVTVINGASNTTDTSPDNSVNGQ